VPFSRNLALRAFDRWQASWIICVVAEVRGAVPVAVVKLPAFAADVAVAVDVVVV